MKRSEVVGLTESEKYYQKMTQTPVSRLILALGLPTTVSMLITNIYNLADTYFIGTLGFSQQGATGILFTLQAIIQALAFMLGHGSGTYVSKALADKNTKEATKYVSTAFFVALGVGFILSLSGLLFLEPFMRLLGSTDTILPYAKDYGLWVLIAAPFMLASLVLNNNLRYEGKAFYAMIGLTIGGVTNIFGDYVLIVVFQMGVFGAGLSTAVSQIISFAILLIMYIKTAQSKISIKAFSLKLRVHINIVRAGFPSLVRQGLASISNGLLNNLIKPFGDAAIAAISVVNRFTAFCFCLGLGVGQGYQPVAAFNFRAKEYNRVKKGLIFTTVFGVIFVGILAVIGFSFAEWVIFVFQKNEETIKIGAFALRMACIGLAFLPLSVPINMLYQSIRKSGIATLLAIMRSGAVFIPTIYVLSYFFGLNGILSSQPLADVITGLVSIPFIIHFIRTDFTKEENQDKEPDAIMED